MELKRRWKDEYGFDKVEMPKYKVLMSFPDKQNPNQVILLVNGKEVYRVNEKEQVTKCAVCIKTFFVTFILLTLEQLQSMNY